MTCETARFNTHGQVDNYRLQIITKTKHFRWWIRWCIRRRSSSS